MATTTARTRSDVDSMDTRSRLWDSLNYSYGKKKEATAENYRKAYSQADNQLLSRGMQRSSYGAQTLANINEQGIRAQGDIDDALIADYENRLYQLERDEKADEQWERQFAEGQRQFDTNLAYNKERAAVADQQWQKNYDYQVGRDTVADQQWQASFDFNKEQAAQQQANADRAYDYQVGRDAVADQQWQTSFDYQAGRDLIADEQWQKAFDQSSDQFNRQLAASYAQALISAGMEVPQSLLQQAGLKVVGGQLVPAGDSSGGGGYYGGGSGGKSSTSTSSSTSSKLTDADLLNPLGMLGAIGVAGKAISAAASAFTSGAQKETKDSGKSTNKKTVVTKN